MEFIPQYLEDSQAFHREKLKGEGNNSGRPAQRAQQPVVDLPLSRAARRVLAPTGAVRARLPNLAEAAGAAASLLWRQCQDQQIVVWLDNWYWKVYGTDPVRPDQSLNVSVMAILHITDVPVFPGHPTLVDLVNRVTLAAGRLSHVHGVIVADARKVAEVQLAPNMIRVPLDIQRHGMRSLQWRPYVITPETVSSQRDLLSIVHGLR